MDLQNSITFTADHTKMSAGIYIPNIDALDDWTVYTIDIRVKQPYVDRPMTEMEAHSYEHNFATALREEGSKLCDLNVLYFGPMGCMTGFYALIALKGTKYYPNEAANKAILELLYNAAKVVDTYDDVVAKSKLRCGNWTTLGNKETIEPINSRIKELLSDCISNDNMFNEYVYIKEETNE